MVRTQNVSNEKTSKVKTFIIFMLFIASLQIFSLTIGGHGLSANYVYVFFPVVFWFVGIKRRLVRRHQVVKIIMIYIFIYFIGLPGDYLAFGNDIITPIRRLTSFIIFLFPLLLSIIEFKPCDVDIFKRAVIISSVYYSLGSILSFCNISDLVGVSSMKGVFGSNRYGFILCLGFFISLFSDKLIIKKWFLQQRVFFCSVIFLGIIFTFSRAAILAFVGGVVFYCVLALLSKKEKVNIIYYIISFVLVTFVFILFQSYFGVNILHFYQIHLIDPFLDSTFKYHILDAGKASSSEGYRYYIIIRVLEYLAAHPLFGSCYKGLYLLYDEFEGGISTHNQYADVFLRTGLFGGALWLFLLYRVFRFCSHDRGLQVGLVAIIIYGLFHETFKESHGSFVFGMLLSFSYMRASIERQSHNQKTNYKKQITNKFQTPNSNY